MLPANIQTLTLRFYDFPFTCQPWKLDRFYWKHGITQQPVLFIRRLAARCDHRNHMLLISEFETLSTRISKIDFYSTPQPTLVSHKSTNHRRFKQSLRGWSDYHICTAIFVLEDKLRPALVQNAIFDHAPALMFPRLGLVF